MDGREYLERLRMMAEAGYPSETLAIGPGPDGALSILVRRGNPPCPPMGSDLEPRVSLADDRVWYGFRQIMADPGEIEGHR